MMMISFFFLLSFFLAFFDFDLLSVTESLAPFSAALKSSEQTVSSLSSDPSLSHTNTGGFPEDVQETQDEMDNPGAM